MSNAEGILPNYTESFFAFENVGRVEHSDKYDEGDIEEMGDWGWLMYVRAANTGE